MGFVKEFKDFAVKGNVVDMAVGIIIGGAFGKIVASMVGDVIMPVVSLATAGVDFSQIGLALDDVKNAAGEVIASPTLAQAKEARVAFVAYGTFLQTVIDFVIIALVIFIMIKQMNKLKKAEAPKPAAAPTTHPCPKCLSAIPLKATRCGFCTSEVKPA